jgi:hypothetical protein
MEGRMAICRKSSTLTFGTLYLKLESKHGKSTAVIEGNDDKKPPCDAIFPTWSSTVAPVWV